MAMGFLTKRSMVICRIGGNNFQWNFTIFRNNMDFTIVYNGLKNQTFNAYERLHSKKTRTKRVTRFPIMLEIPKLHQNV